MDLHDKRKQPYDEHDDLEDISEEETDDILMTISSRR